MTKNPFEQFGAWLEQAKHTPAIAEPTAMAVATVGAAGAPSLRMLLLKSYDVRGFVFFTNNESRKGGELQENKQVALCFYWMVLGRQIRIEGMAEAVSEAEADAYFFSRPRDSRIGAWASQQSRPLASRESLEAAIQETTARFEGKEVPRPPYWSGWRVVPSRIEFWEERPFRLHHREVFTRDASGNWGMGLLYP